MTYFVVMGGLALSLSVLAGWTLWRCLRWLGRRLGLSRGRQQARGSSGRSTRAHSRPKQEKLKLDQADKAKSGKASASKATSQKATSQKAGERSASQRGRDRTPSEPWKLTRALAPLAATWSLALVAGLLYGGARLAEFGMAARPGSAPAAYHRLVEVIGLGAAGLAGITLIGGLAWWRCYRADKARD
ncbi:hypothetical protein [Halomonas halmophila]|uniref:Uncharacterized protein n=1 Tax=Halomonas halmophila TaxID=252 RepID=A0A4Y4F6K8_9GAMM|nr:hypothetical protein [Halomonas halmophila]GED22748.1 hypothetical protein HHA01_17250 [Halomonas halmophila]